MRSDSASLEETPRSCRWKPRTLFDSDEECASVTPFLGPQLDKDTDLRTRLFDDDEESRDSGVGLGNDCEDDICCDLPARSFAMFAKKADIDLSPNPRAQPQMLQQDSPVKESSENTLLPQRGLSLPQKRVRPSQCGGSPSRHKRAKTARFRRCNSLTTPTSEKQIPAPTAEEEAESDSGSDDERLTGDNRKKLCLPTIAGKHRDLNSITPETLSHIVNSNYSDTIGKAVIVDCRYPYEYEGGHIQGAINCYTKETLLELFMKNPSVTESDDKPYVLIFHCEFSSERAPKMSRFLRKMDRNANKECYPKLFYPEIYLLDGGYKNFFSFNKDLCTPQGYVPMHHKEYKEDMKKFRIKSKSWSGDKKSRSVFGLS